VPHDDRPTVATGTGFAERLLEVVDSGRRTATYKLALLLALLDLCALHSDTDGRAPTELTTRDLAEQVASLYWPQVAPFRLGGSPEALELRQITNKRSLIIDALRAFRVAVEPTGATSLWIARQRFPTEYGRVIDRIERTLAEQPLPRLQTVGTSETEIPFIYELGADWGINQHFFVERLRSHGPRGPVIPLLDGAGDELVRLSPLVRPLVELHWTRMVAQLNRVATDEEDLRHHLFGTSRIVPPKILRDGLRGLQANRCFYCGTRLVGPTEVDHFIARARSANDAIENLVLADRSCNGDKSDLLAAPSFVADWAARNRDQAGALTTMAELSAVESDHEGTMAVARSTYAHLPPDGTPMWHGRKQVFISDPGLALAALHQLGM
jgi:5-methylcytosine-specific restriction endonuclease McrA